MDEKQNNYERLKAQNDLFFKAVMEKFKILPTICSLAATLLVVATFNENLLPINTVVKILISILLSLISVSLFFYLFELNDLANKAQKKIEEIISSNITTNRNCFQCFRGCIPWVVWLILSAIITVLITLIWK
jgi:hypothetical protein